MSHSTLDFCFILYSSHKVLLFQGHIALDQAVFPERTPGFVLDVLARSSLWKIGLDYRHGTFSKHTKISECWKLWHVMLCKLMINFSLVPGTGHGVGAALNVHEGPQSISYRYGNLTALQKGMIVSNEPGYYEDNSFGIRIEVGFPTLCSCQSPKFLGLN